MHSPARLLATILTALFLEGSSPAAEVFDYYVNPVLARAIEAKETKEIKQLTTTMIVDNDRVLPHTRSAFLVVKTNQGRYAKLLVQAARQRIDAERSIPMLLIDRYVTYKDGEERAVQADGKNLSLFPGFRLSLDLGQVVPEELGGDLRFVVKGDKIYTEPVGKAKLYLVTKALADAVPKKGAKFVAGETFEPRWFTGTYHLHSDGRRSGKLILKVQENGKIGGSYYSDKDGAKYPVSGRIGTPKHAIQFTIKFPRSVETFQGFLFTGNGQAITGTSRLQEREAGFYAKRVEE
ncbi:MAG: hypothetical protein ACRELF_11015 [Gemmataceae bacterium]